MSSNAQFAIQNPKSRTALPGILPRGFRRVLFLLMVIAAIVPSFKGARWPAVKAASETSEFHRPRFVELFAAPSAVIPLRPTAMTFVVNTTNDTLSAGACATATPGQCSLREAIVEANANAGADTIDATGVKGTVNLTGALPNITEALTINGPGASLLTVRRSTGGDYRIFTLMTGGVVTFSGMTIKDGKSDGGGGILISGSGTTNINSCALIGNLVVGSGGEGGGLYNSGSGTLNVTNSTLSGNFTGAGAFGGGGITSNSGLNVTNSTLDGNSCIAPCGGGGIAGGNPLNITNSVLRNNSAGEGGGIATGGGVTVTNSTLSNNSAQAGGGIACGGILNIVNTTLSNNSAALGAAIFSGGDGTLNVTNATISGNFASANGSGAGIYKVPPGTATIKSTIVALNMAPSSGDLNGIITSQGYNIVGTTSGASIVATTGDQFGVTAAQLKLGPLGNNGGPTQTMALGYGSVAIDQGINSNSLATDQRGVGFARTYDDPAVTNATGGKGTDVGAFEAKQTFPNICETEPWLCQGLCKVPCPPCAGGCLYEIIFEELVDPWQAVLFDPRGNLVRVQQVKRGNQITMRFRVNEQFADKVGEYTVMFRGGKPGTRPGARFQVKAIQ